MFAESASLQDQNASHTGAPGTLSWSVLNCNTVRLHEKQEKVLFLNQKYIFISIFLKRMGRGGGDKISTCSNNNNNINGNTSNDNTNNNNNNNNNNNDNNNSNNNNNNNKNIYIV